MPTFWTALEQVPGLNAITATWTGLMGPEFETVRATYFRKQAEPARAWFCEKCYCAHEVIAGSAARSELASLVAVCRCETGRCPDIALTPAEIEIWELSWSSLGRALCRALGLEASTAEMPIHNTRQIGSWSADAVPAFLTIQTEPEDLRGAIAELVARLQQPFILLTPTASLVNGTCRELLSHAKADFFALDLTVRFTEHATLRPASAPVKLFTRFNPQPRGILEEDVARKAMAMVKTLDFGPAPTPLAVFRLYCVEGLTMPEAASELGCTATTIYRRLQRVRKRTGKTPAELRTLSPYFNGREGQP